MILTPKGGWGGYRVIRLVGEVWKVVTVIRNRHLSIYISFQKIIHRFQMCSVTGTASIEAKLLQKLVAMREEGLYAIIMDLHKLYDDLDR